MASTTVLLLLGLALESGTRKACLDLPEEPLLGALSTESDTFVNGCPWKVAFQYCVEHPKDGSAYDCKRQKFGAGHVEKMGEKMGRKTISVMGVAGGAFNIRWYECWASAANPDPMTVGAHYSETEGVVARCFGDNAGTRPAAGQDRPELAGVLEPGEELMELSDGCSVVIGAGMATDDPNRPSTMATLRGQFEGKHWTGECRSGLAHGKGAFLTAAGWTNSSYNEIYVLGRNPQVAGKIGYIGLQSPEEYFYVDGKSIALQRQPNPLAPIWRPTAEYAFGDGRSSLLVVQGRSYATDTRSCLANEQTAKLRGCDWYSEFPVFGIVLSGQGIVEQYFPCPDPRTPVGCEALWTAKAGPAITEINAHLAEYRRRLDELNARYSALLTPAWQAAWAARQGKAASRVTSATSSPAEPEQASQVKAAALQPSGATTTAACQPLTLEDFRRNGISPFGPFDAAAEGLAAACACEIKAYIDFLKAYPQQLGGGLSDPAKAGLHAISDVGGKIIHLLDQRRPSDVPRLEESIRGYQKQHVYNTRPRSPYSLYADVPAEDPGSLAYICLNQARIRQIGGL